MLTKKDWVLLCSIAYALKSDKKADDMKGFLNQVADGFSKIMESDRLSQLDVILEAPTLRDIK